MHQRGTAARKRDGGASLHRLLDESGLRLTYKRQQYVHGKAADDHAEYDRNDVLGDGRPQTVDGSGEEIVFCSFPSPDRR